MTKLEFYGKVNFLKGAITSADFITTREPQVCPGDSNQRIWLWTDKLYWARSGTVAGILNGVDYGKWNPETDTHLEANYSASDLRGKAACKRALLKEFGLSEDTQLPVVGIVSRFAGQKGFDLIQQVSDRMAREDLIVVALGTGEL